MYKHIIILYLTILSEVILAQGSGRTLAFNGIDESVDLGDNVANSCRTIEMWFKPEIDIDSSLPSPISLIARDFNNGSILSTNEFAITFYPVAWGNPGQLGFIRRVGSSLHEIFSDSDQWTAGHWYHIAVTIDPVSGMSMFINGVKQQSTDPSVSPIGNQSGNASDKVSIAKWGNLDTRYFTGEIDELRLWESERDQIEIRRNMCSMLIGTEFGLRAYYSFNGLQTTQLEDSGPNGHHGTPLNLDDSDKILSGAPIGDTSTFIYNTAGLTNETLKLETSNGDFVQVQNINSTANGVHIYKVNSVPNSNQNLTSLLTNGYYGIFLTDISGRFDVVYDVSDFDCSACINISSRNDNSISAWDALNEAHSNCTFQLTRESVSGDSYRAEYIIDQRIVDINLSDDTLLCPGETLILNATVPDARYLWQDGSQNSTFSATSPGTYSVLVTIGGCTTTQSITLTLDNCDALLLMPNAFTPNDDGKNDLYTPIETVNIASMRTMIFNRWGKLIFQTNNKMIEWDGTYENSKAASTGVYYWHVIYTTQGGQSNQMKGWLTLIR